MGALRRHARRAARRRRIGPLGTTARLAGGLLVIAATAAGGLRAWDIAGALVVIPAIATLALALRAQVSRPGAPARLDADRPMHPGARFVLVAVVIGAATALTFATPIDAGAIWLFLGVSLLVAALRRDDGCELLALPNAITGREDSVGCLVLTPVDRAEARRAAR